MKIEKLKTKKTNSDSKQYARGKRVSLHSNVHLAIFNFQFAIFLFLLPLILSSCDPSGHAAFTREQYRAAATALYQQQLYLEAVNMYADFLKSTSIPGEDVPKVLYQMGNIYQDNLLDPKAALAKYSVLKALYPDETFNNQLGKRMVACLETMGRSVDASQALSRMTNLTTDSSHAPGNETVVAELEGRKITLGEIASMVGKLPDAPLERNQLVREYVAQILVAEAARRKGVADRPEVKIRIGQMENQILAQAGLLDEIKISPPTGNDLKYYFEANKQRYLQGPDSNATFEKLAPRVQADWAREKQGAEYQKYVERLLQTAKVNFYSQSTGSASHP